MKYLNLILIAFLSLAPFSCQKAKEPPTVMVIFGASGDLTSKKILPALDQLALKGRLPKNFAVIGVARKTEEQFRKNITFGQNLQYVQADFKEDLSYQNLADRLKEIEQTFGAKSNRIYFLATQPSYFSTIVEQLSNHGLVYKKDNKEWSRVMIEKPFGHDLQSAIELQETISHFLDESLIYRIDHYLGKEGVQNLIEFRLRGDLESRWNKEYIDRVEITLAEEIGIGARANLWEETGLIRDVVQNHMMQLLSIVAMDLGGDIPLEKIKVLEAVSPIDSMIRGQYGPGTIQGKEVVGYKQEKGISEMSTAETLASGNLWIDNNRWRGVPFHIQAGKRLSQQITEIVVTFKTKEVLHIRIQPQPAIFFQNGRSMNFEPFPFSEAYQKLIYDCLQGDHSSFVQKEEQLAAWRIVSPALASKDALITYPSGTWQF